jgi:hypothetical protein
MLIAAQPSAYHLVMRLGSAIIVMLVPAGVASAPARLPTTPVPCIPQTGTPELLARDGRPVVCWVGGCMSIQATSGQVEAVDRPSAPTPSTTVSKRADGGFDVCAGTTCKKVGKKLAAHLAGVDVGLAEVTSDLRAVSTGLELWSVAGDRKLALKQPKQKHTTNDPFSLGGIHVAATLVVADWRDCAGPCTIGTLVDSSGNPRGTVTSGGGVVALKGAIAIASDWGAVTFVSTKTGKLVDSVDVAFGASSHVGLVALGDDAVAELREPIGGAGHIVDVITLYGQAAATSQHFFPACPTGPLDGRH